MKLDIEDYFEVIKQPMDFGTIKVTGIIQNKLYTNLYESAADFTADVRL